MDQTPNPLLVLMPYHPIMYCSDLDVTTTHDLHQEVSYVTFTPKIYPMALYLLQMMEKFVPPMTNTPYILSSSIFLALPFIGKPKPDQHLQPIW